MSPVGGHKSSKRQIIKLVKKISSKHGHLLHESDINHSCSPGVCGANLPMQHTIGDEYTWASEGMAGLLSQGCDQVKELTTDPDSGAGQAGESLFKDGLPGKSTYSLTRHSTFV